MLSKAAIEQRALSYLNRFDATRRKLSLVLTRYIKKTVVEEGRAAALELATEVLERYQQSGILDDHRFSANHARALRLGGASRRLTEQKLRLRGVASEVIEETLRNLEVEDPGGDLVAARTYVRKRRLGPYRATEEQRLATRHKDLAALARRGFSHDVARRALATPDADVF